MHTFLRVFIALFLSVSIFPICSAFAQGLSPSSPTAPNVIAPRVPAPLPLAPAPNPMPSAVPTAPTPLPSPMPSSSLSPVPVAPVFPPAAGVPVVSSTPSPSGPGQAKTDLLIVLDVSGSMNSLLDGQLMIDWAKQAIAKAMALLPAEAEVGLRVYSHRVDKSNKEASCRDTELLVPIGRGNAATVSSIAQTLTPKGMTPIAYSLEQAANDFAGHSEKLHTIILVSDGEETCGGDPMAAARSLIQRGYKVVINTIGFNVDGVARAQLKGLAEQFGGTYSDVRSGTGLSQEIQKLTQQTFLIDKKTVKNEIRGGDSFATAVPIQLNTRYNLDHHQRKDQYDYFVFNLKQGEAVAVRVFPTPKCLEIEGTQAKEISNTFCSPEGFRFVLLDGQQKELERLAEGSVDRQHESKYYTASAPGTTPYYLVVGSPFRNIHKDHEFMLVTKQGEVTVTSQDTGDANAGRDAGDSFVTAIPIEPGLYDVNRVSEPLDLIDIFKIKIPAGNAFKVVMGGKRGSSGGNETDIEVVSDLGEIISQGEIAAGNSLSYELPAVVSDRTVYVRVKLDEKSYWSNQFLEYTIAYNLTPSAVAPVQTAPVTPPSSGETVRSSASSTPAPASSAAAPTFQLWFLWVILVFVLGAATLLIVFLKKAKKLLSQPSILGKSLAWYEIVASVIGFGVGVYALASLPTFAWQLSFAILFTLIGLLGLLAGGMLLSKSSLRPSFWWLYLQLPWLSLNLHWLNFDYGCSFGLGAPIHFVLEVLDRLHFKFGIHPELGANLHFQAFFSFPGSGFKIGLGINLIAFLLLILLVVYRRKLKTSTSKQG